MLNKDIDFKIKKELGDISVSEDFIDFTEEVLKNLPEKKKIINKRNMLKKGIMVAGISSIVLIGSSFMYPAMAKSLPVVNKIFEKFYEYGYVSKDYVNYSNTINQSDDSEGVTINFDDIIIENGSLILNYRIISNKEFTSVAGIWDSVLNINGIKLDDPRTDDFGKLIKEEEGKYYYDQVSEIDISNINLEDFKENIEIEFIIKNLDGIDGQWRFALKTKKEKTYGKSKMVNLNTDVKCGEDIYTIKKVTLGSFKSKIEFEGKEENEDIGLPIIGVFTDKGDILKPFRGESSKERGSVITNSIREIPSKLTFIPYKIIEGTTDNIKPIKKISVREFMQNNKPIDIKAGENVNIRIGRANIDENMLTIDFNIDGYGVYASLIDVEDSNGEKALWNSGNNPSINRLDNGRRLYYIDPDKEYYINIYNQDDYITLDLDNIKHVELD